MNKTDGLASGRETTYANLRNPKGPMCHTMVALAPGWIWLCMMSADGEMNDLSRSQNDGNLWQ